MTVIIEDANLADFLHKSRPQKVGESRESYLRRALRFCKVVENRLVETGKYRHFHESFLIRDVLLYVEAAFYDLGTFGVEFIEAGSNSQSPAITYLNTGETYDLTLMHVWGKYRIGSWGTIVECGNYA